MAISFKSPLSGWCFIVLLSSAKATTDAAMKSGDTFNISCALMTYNIGSCTHLNLTTEQLLESLEFLPNSVTTLDLSYNKLKTIPPSVFFAFVNVTVLHLEYNLLEYLSGSDADSFHNLNKLFLQHNLIRSLKPEVFILLPFLQLLDLGYNHISSIGTNTFVNATNLSVLNLEYNNITEIPSDAFKGSSLSQINLSGNRIHFYKTGAFLSVPFLELLNLSSTHLSVIDKHLFEDLVSVKSIDLSNNNLTSIDSAVVDQFQQIINMTMFDLSSNPFNCDCRLTELLRWLQSSSFATRTQTPLCNSPAGLSKVNLLNVSFETIMNCASTAIVFTSATPFRNYITLDPNVSYMEPPPYDKMLGWYTALVLGGVLMLFLLCLLLDKMKRKYYVRLKRKLRNLENSEQTESGDKNKDSVEINTPDIQLTASGIALDEYDVIGDAHEQSNRDTEPLQPSPLDRKKSLVSLTSFKFKSSRETSEMKHKPISNIAEYQPVFSRSVDDKIKPKTPFEFVPGITILEVNPECPLHGFSKQPNGAISSDRNNMNNDNVNGYKQSTGAVPKKPFVEQDFNENGHSSTRL